MNISLYADARYLQTRQYKTAANLKARITLHTRFSLNSYGWMKWVFDQFELPDTCRILELGCGSGLLWVENIGRLPSGWKIILSDFSRGMLEEATSSLTPPHQENIAGEASRRRQFSVGQIDAQAIPFDEATLDAVIANHMLYHVPDLDKTLDEIRRVIKAEGVFYASTVGETHLQELHQLIARFIPGADEWSKAFTETFTLENGAAKLTPWFPKVRLLRYPDALLVTEVEPLMDYILSTARRAVAPPEEQWLPDLRRAIEQAIATEGAIRINKDSGMFVGQSE